MSKIETFIYNGKQHFICEDCGNHMRVDNMTKCKNCGAWYEMIIEKTVPGAKP